MSGPHPSLAILLGHNVDLVVRTLQATGTDDVSAMSALIAARTAAEVLDDVTRVLVADARRAGTTWAEIGQLLRISRQAAQQRFPDTPADHAPDEDDDVVGRALQITEQLREHDWPGVAADWDEVMRAKLTVDEVEKVWRRVARNAGELRTVGRPSVVRKGPYRIVDVPLAFEHGPMRARVTFNRDGTVAGLFIMSPDDGSS